MTTMVLTAELKSRVTARVIECIDKIEKQYKVRLQMPTILYTLTGTTAGWAKYRSWTLNFNAALLVRNLEDYFAETIPHELCHLATEKIYPEAHRRTYGQKRRPHGYEWQSIMRAIGCEPSRTHNYDTTEVAHRKASYTYVCARCEKSYELGPKRHAKLTRNKRAYWCKCGGDLCLQGAKAAVKPAVSISATTARKVPAVRTPAPTKTFTVSDAGQYNSKFEHCYAIYKATVNTLTKDDIIRLFIEQVGMTAAGASTYFYKCKA